MLYWFWLSESKYLPIKILKNVAYLKSICYNIDMRYEIELTKDAKKEFLELSTENKTLLIDYYKTIQ